jgi:phosphoenolpyruvate carboxylase
MERELDGLDDARAEVVIRAFLLHFRLANLAEERQRVRILEARGRRSRPGATDDTFAGVSRTLRAEAASQDPRPRGGHRAALRLHPVLTAHPTEARRRTALQALGRVGRILDARDDPRLVPAAARALDDRLREEVTILWRTAEVRPTTPLPLDEVGPLSSSTRRSTRSCRRSALARAAIASRSRRPGEPSPVLRWGS